MKHILPLITLLIAGCAIPGPQYSKWNPDENESLLMDAKQRIVINTNQGGPDRNRRVVCAEPSPDALSALSTKLNADVNAKGFISQSSPLGEGKGSEAMSAGLERSVNETASSITERTQAIQLLRDGLYRACEAHLNGVIGKDEYKSILYSYDEVLIALVALDGLEGDKKAEAVHKITRDYYCLQLAYREDIDERIVTRMCAQ